MILLTYDISSDKKRAKFSKFIEKYGVRIQYSVFKIKNSKRVLDNVLVELNHSFKKYFDDSDSVYIFQICERCDKSTIKFGSSRHEDVEVIYFD